MVNQKRYSRKRSKRNRTKRNRVKRRRVKRSRVKQRRVNRTRMRGGMEGAAAGAAAGESPNTPSTTALTLYDFGQTYNPANYQDWKDMLTKNEIGTPIYGRAVRQINIYETMCRVENGDLPEGSVQTLQEKYRREADTKRDMESAGRLQISVEEYLRLKESAKVLQISVEEYLKLKDSVDKNKSPVSNSTDGRSGHVGAKMDL
jgi:hypothetical protein